MPELHRKSPKLVEDVRYGTDLASLSTESAGVSGKTPARGFPLRLRFRPAVPYRPSSTSFPVFSCKCGVAASGEGPLLGLAPSRRRGCCRWVAVGPLREEAVFG